MIHVLVHVMHQDFRFPLTGVYLLHIIFSENHHLKVQLISPSFDKFNILITIDIDLFSLLYASFDIIKSIQLRAKRFLFILMTRKKISKYNSNAMINCMYEYNTLTRSTSVA